jgi:hypothetical protein
MAVELVTSVHQEVLDLILDNSFIRHSLKWGSSNYETPTT